MKYLRLKDVVMMFCLMMLILALIVLPQVKKYPAVPFGGGGGVGFQITLFDPIGWLGGKISDFLDWLAPTGGFYDKSPTNVNQGLGGGGGGGF